LSAPRCFSTSKTMSSIAGEVLLRRFELQLGGTAPRLVLGDARRLLDQLPSVGRPRAEDHSDLALLDDRVGLCAEAGIHEQLVDVPQAADFPVDEVLALARSIEAAGDLHVAGELLDRRGQRRLVIQRRGCRCMSVPIGCRRGYWSADARNALERVERQITGLPPRRDEAGELQSHLGGGARLARVAAAEDDILHLVAAQALGALFPEHPGDGVGDVALAAAVGADDGRHASIEGELCTIGETLEAGNLETFETHNEPSRSRVRPRTLALRVTGRSYRSQSCRCAVEHVQGHRSAPRTPAAGAGAAPARRAVLEARRRRGCPVPAAGVRTAVSLARAYL
jgi:hypothetical protein